MMGMLGALAGLGKGLSMIGEDGLKTIQRNEEAAASEERQKRVAEWQAKMNQEYKIQDEERAVERKRGEERQLSEADDKATTRAKELGTARRMEDFKAKLSQTDATEAELQEAFKQYDNKAVQAGDKVDTQFMDKRRADAAGDYVKAARETGNTGLLSQAKQSMDFAVKQDDADAKTAREERKADLAESNSQRRWEIEQAKIDARYFGDKKDATNKDFIGYIRESRMAINNEKDRLVSLMKAETEAELNPDKKAAIVRGYKERMAKLDTKADELDGDMKAFKAKAFDGGSRSDPATGKPSGVLSQAGSGKRYAGVNEDGSVKYEPAGSSAKLSSGEPQANEKDRVAIITAEYEKAVASGNDVDAKALSAELKRLGVNVSAKPSESKPSGTQSDRLSKFTVIR